MRSSLGWLFAAIIIFISLGAGGYFWFLYQAEPDGPSIPKIKVVGREKDVQFVEYERDGLRLYAEVYFPPRTTRSLRTLIVIPGGFWGPHRDNRQMCRLLASKGYLVTLPHLRGQGKSEGEITFCKEEGADVQHLARAMKRLGGRGDYAYVGVSFGAAIALNAARNDSNVRGIVSLMGPYDFLEQLETLKRVGNRQETVQRWMKWMGGDPHKNPALYEPRDPLRFAREVEAPLLIFQAGKDPLVHTRQVCQLMDVRLQMKRPVNRVALNQDSTLWTRDLPASQSCLEPLTGFGNWHDDHIILFPDLTHKTIEPMRQMTFQALMEWFK
jgi:dienelactone hydrolase